MKRLSAEANARGRRTEAHVFRAVKTAERLKRRAEEAEIRAKNAENALVVNRESDAMHNCALVERASRRVTDERAKSEDLERDWRRRRRCWKICALRWRPTWNARG